MNTFKLGESKKMRIIQNVGLEGLTWYKVEPAISTIRNLIDELGNWGYEPAWRGHNPTYRG